MWTPRQLAYQRQAEAWSLWERLHAAQPRDWSLRRFRVTERAFQRFLRRWRAYKVLAGLS